VDDPRDSRSVPLPGQAQIIQLRKAVRGPTGKDANGCEAGSELSGYDLFTLLWRALADVLGTAAGATLLRRAAQRAALTWPELSSLSITRESLEYVYEVPDAWHEPSPNPPQALRELVRELWTFLVELTGAVVVGRLLQVTELRARGIVPPPEPQS